LASEVDGWGPHETERAPNFVNGNVVATHSKSISIIPPPPSSSQPDSLTINHVQPDAGPVQVGGGARVVALVRLDRALNGEGGDGRVVRDGLEAREAAGGAHGELLVVVPEREREKES
jgi:hypothetical protein